MKALRRAFPDCQSKFGGDALEALAAQGFLLVDSIPFAMDYSSRSRSTDEYRALVHLTAMSYLQQTVLSSEFDWAPDLRIAFSLKLNALAVMEVLGELSVGGRRHPLSPHMIAVNCARYPDAGKIRQVFGLA